LTFLQIYVTIAIMNNDHELVEELCQNYGTLIEKAFIRAVAHFYKLHENELLTIRPSTKAALINDYIYQYIQEGLDGAGSFEFISKRAGRFIGYNSKILIRIKKLSRAREPSVNKTVAANRFNTQADMELFEGARASNIYLGYVLNNASGNIDQVAFAYPNTDGVIAWTINVEEETAQRTLDIDIIPRPRRPRRLTPRIPKRKTSKK